jgi:hypothetical protein
VKYEGGGRGEKGRCNSREEEEGVTVRTTKMMLNVVTIAFCHCPFFFGADLSAVPLATMQRPAAKPAGQEDRDVHRAVVQRGTSLRSSIHTLEEGIGAKNRRLVLQLRLLETEGLFHLHKTTSRTKAWRKRVARQIKQLRESSPLTTDETGELHKHLNIIEAALLKECGSCGGGGGDEAEWNVHINTVGPEGSTPLIYYCKEGAVETVRLLLQCGANPLLVGEVNWTEVDEPDDAYTGAVRCANPFFFGGGSLVGVCR